MQELCGLAGVAPSSPPAGLMPEEWTALHAEWQRWLQVLQQGERHDNSPAFTIGMTESALMCQDGAAHTEPFKGTGNQAVARHWDLQLPCSEIRMHI